MAIPNRSTNPLCHVLVVDNVVTIVPLNADAKEALDALYAAESDSDTVALTQTDAGRGGIGQTGPTNALILTLTTA